MKNATRFEAGVILADRDTMFDLFSVPLDALAEKVFLLRGPLSTISRFLDLRDEAIVRVAYEADADRKPEVLIWKGSNDLGNKSCFAIRKIVAKSIERKTAEEFAVRYNAFRNSASRMDHGENRDDSIVVWGTMLLDVLKAIGGSDVVYIDDVERSVESARERSRRRSEAAELDAALYAIERDRIERSGVNDSDEDLVSD